MGRRSHSRALAVWINGLHAATWRLAARGPVELQYEPDWLNSIYGRPLSLSLPFQPGNEPLRGEVVTNYFDNLLPDSEAIRRRVAQRYRAPSTEAFELLQQIGRDCVGAVQLLPPGQAPSGHEQITGRALSEADVESLLLRMVRPPGGLGAADDAGEDLRLSIAGAQEKTALLWHAGQWVLPSGSTPTTHILKLPMGRVGNEGRLDMGTSVENEWLCLRILEAYGLRVPRAAMLRFGQQKVLAVERFDREFNPAGWWMRLLQEDFCQAKGLPPRLKYEQDGGPGMEAICDILAGSRSAGQDLQAFMSAQILFWMLAATDGHAKNFSIRLLSQGEYQLTPFYDVVSVWPIIGRGANKLDWKKARLAMSVRGASRHYALHQIQRRHFNATAARCGIGGTAQALIGHLIEQTPGVIQRVSHALPRDFPAQVAEPILDNLALSAQRLEKMPPA